MTIYYLLLLVQPRWTHWAFCLDLRYMGDRGRHRPGWIRLSHPPNWLDHRNPSRPQTAETRCKPCWQTLSLCSGCWCNLTKKKKTSDHIKNSLQDEWERRRFWITRNFCENYLVMHWQKVEWFLWADGRLRRPFDCQARDWHRSCRDSDLKALSEPPSRSLPNGQVWSWSIVCTGVGKL